MRQTMTRDLKHVVAGAEGNYYPLDLAPRAKDVPAVIGAIRGCVAEDEHFEVSFSGSYFSNRGMVGQLVGVLAVALLLLFFILAAQFESLRPAMDHPLGNRHRPLRGARRPLGIRADAQPDVDDRADRGLRHRDQRLDPQDRHHQYAAASRAWRSSTPSWRPGGGA